MKVEINDIVKVNGREYEVERVLYCEFWDRYGYDVEFIDTSGNYHHWISPLEARTGRRRTNKGYAATC